MAADMFNRQLGLVRPDVFAQTEARSQVLDLVPSETIAFDGIGSPAKIQSTVTAGLGQNARSSIVAHPTGVANLAIDSTENCLYVSCSLVQIIISNFFNQSVIWRNRSIYTFMGSSGYIRWCKTSKGVYKKVQSTKHI
jgi:hypothetical protein